MRPVNQSGAVFVPFSGVLSFSGLTSVCLPLSVLDELQPTTQAAQMSRVNTKMDVLLSMVFSEIVWMKPFVRWNNCNLINCDDKQKVAGLLTSNRCSNYHIVTLRASSPRKAELTMTQDIGSVFDLTPSTKLQLVEDLWDDLASTTETIPVQDWQKEQLAHRKANLLDNPASGLSWDEVKRRVHSRYGR